MAFWGFFMICILGFFTTIGFYFELEEYHREHYQPYGHYILFNAICFFVLNIVFTIMTFLRLKKTIQTFHMAFVAMIIADFACIYAIASIWTANPLLF